ncbi:hypothetical protein Agub_g5210 [Astrephomene gubernaculifera]|uniref:gamma-glutamylcyclotransferase n=1 Tax=Astrephomene gubernaculifera TaxID=47775 RepID=A0AAD3DLI0_9CHLO|nr:hypothetical protein Agub_g5210 [Astrephomene gubernaculifera]
MGAAPSTSSPTLSQSSIPPVQLPSPLGSSHGPDGVWYFAYGSNMNPNTLTGRRKVVPLESWPAVLHGWTLSFRMLGLPYTEPGFATIERASNDCSGASSSPSPSAASKPTRTSTNTSSDGTNSSTSSSSGSPHSPGQQHQQHSSGDSDSDGASSSTSRWLREVHGVLHRVRVADWVQVMATEGVSGGKTSYRVVEVEVVLYDGRRTRALTLQGQPPSLHSPARPVAPSRRYLDLLREGARHHGLHPAYLAHLDSLQPYQRAGWAPVVGRGAALALALPLLLPLLPPVLYLRAASARKAGGAAAAGARAGGGAGGGAGARTARLTAGARSGEEKGDNDSSTSSGGSSSAGSGDGGAISVVAAAASATQYASDLPSKTAAAVASAAPPAAEELSASIARAAAAPSEGPLPPELLRPPLTLPFGSAVSYYILGVQWVIWVVHDYVAAPVLGSGSAGGSSEDAGN